MEKCQFSPAKKIWDLNYGLIRVYRKLWIYMKMPVSLVGLKKKYGIPQNHFFKYLQIRSFIYSHLKNSKQPLFSGFEKFATQNCIGKRVGLSNVPLIGRKF